MAVAARTEANPVTQVRKLEHPEGGGNQPQPTTPRASKCGARNNSLYLKHLASYLLTNFRNFARNRKFTMRRQVRL